MSRSLVSVGLPVYNGERYLEQALDSLLAQTYDHFEIVISDNASTDRTEEICRAYAERDQRIVYVRQERNIGANPNFNGLLELVRGDFFRWHSYDDLCAPTHLERCVELLTAAPPSVVLCYTGARLIDENGAVVRDHDEHLDLRGPRPEARLAQLVAHVAYVNVFYGLMRIEPLRKTRLFQDYPSADYVFLAELALLGEFWEIPEPLFLRREHPQTSVKANTDLRAMAAFLAPESNRRLLPEFWRLFAEHLKAIHRSPLTRFEKSRTYPRFMVAWLRRRAPIMAVEGVEYVFPPSRRFTAELRRRKGG